MRESKVSGGSGKQDCRERFAAQLRRLRAEAGNPSFRVMASRSRTVSHATLHEAAKGTRFPSWPTTQAFVEACDGDVGEWRERWREALEELEGQGASAPGQSAVADAEVAEGAAAAEENEEPSPVSDDRLAAEGDGEGSGDASGDGSGDGSGEEPAEGSAEDAPASTRRLRRRSVLAAVGAVGTAAGITVAASALVQSDAKKTGPHHTGSPIGRIPVTEATAPRLPGDRSVFIADVTIPDGKVVKTGQRFTKTWEIANGGTVPWHDRYLVRASLPADNGTCSTPGKVRIPDTEPGEHVRISVPVTAPGAPGSCWVGWKMVDGQGRPFLPNARPIYFVVNVTS